jgi:hypothetical protein
MVSLSDIKKDKNFLAVESFCEDYSHIYIPVLIYIAYWVLIQKGVLIPPTRIARFDILISSLLSIVVSVLGIVVTVIAISISILSKSVIRRIKKFGKMDVFISYFKAPFYTGIVLLLLLLLLTNMIGVNGIIPANARNLVGITGGILISFIVSFFRLGQILFEVFKKLATEDDKKSESEKKVTKDQIASKYVEKNKVK